MNPSSVPLQPRRTSSIDKRLEGSSEAIKLHSISGTVYSRTIAYQPLEEDAWSLSDGKRLFDLVCATFGLMVFFPFMILIGLVIAVSSPGPVFSGKKEWAGGAPYLRFTNSELWLPKRKAALVSRCKVTAELRG